MMQTGIKPSEQAQTLFRRLDYFTNRLKLEYLEACCRKTFNPDAIEELGAYYGRPVSLLGGMNEAFRIFLFQQDVEKVRTLADGMPFECTFPPRAGQGGLFLDYDPREEESVQEIDAACNGLLDLVQKENSIVMVAAILTEYLAIKVTAHDLFIHGRGDFPASNLLNLDALTSYVQKVVEAEPDAFRSKHALALALSRGIDPARCVAGLCHCQQRGLDELCQGVQELVRRSSKIKLEDFLRWNVYGICAFIEGPVFLRQDVRSRAAERLALEWEAYDWQAPVTATAAATHLTRRVFHIVLDHKAEFDDTSLEHFLDPANRERYLPRIQTAKQKLAELYEQA